MASANNFDFVVVGAGISGCALALGLHRAGHRVLVVEKESEILDRFKGEYLQPYALEVLRKAGFGPALDNSGGQKISELRFRDLMTSEGRISSEVVIPYPQPYAALALPHKSLLEKLRTQLREELGTDFFLEGASWAPVYPESGAWNMRPVITIKRNGHEDMIASCRILIASDGRASRVRNEIGANPTARNAPPVLGVAPEMIVGCEAENFGLPGFRYEVLRTEKHGTISIFPITDTRARIYWHTKDVAAPTGKNVKDHWRDQIDQAFEEIARSTGLRFERSSRIAGAPALTQWQGPSSLGRVFLIGDALAVTTPLGGQGMSCGLHHVDTLLSFMQNHRGAELEDSAIVREMADLHEASARNIFTHFTVLNTGLYYLFFSRNSFNKALTSHVLWNWNRENKHVERLAALFGGIERDTPSLMEVMKLWGVPLLGAKTLQESRVARIGRKVNPAPIVAWMMNS